LTGGFSFALFAFSAPFASLAASFAFSASLAAL
jgi:hypothetical protein